MKLRGKRVVTFLVLCMPAVMEGGCGTDQVVRPVALRKAVNRGWTIELLEITTSSSIGFESGERSRWLQLHVGIDPPEKRAGQPRKLVDVYFVEATDERGRTIPVTKQKVQNVYEDLHGADPTHGWNSGCSIEIASLSPLPYLPRRLERAKLRMYTATAAETVTRLLELAPMDEPTTIVPGFRFQIKQVVRNDQGLLLSFNYTSAYPDANKEDPRTVPVLIERSLVDSSGQAIFGVTGGSGGTGDGASCQMAGQMRLEPDTKRAPVKLRLVVATKVTLEALDFDFRNLPVTED